LSDEIGVKIKMEGFPVRSSIICRDENNEPSLLLKSLFYQETLKRGILFGPGAVFLSFSHTQKDISKTLDVCEISMKIVKKAIEEKNVNKALKGKVMKRVMTF
jgi:glutamate-1-semialdehyde aminotransferase